MGSKRRRASCSSSSSPSLSSGRDAEKTIAELPERHLLDIENVTLTTQPFRTLRLFFSEMIFYLKRSLYYVLRNGIWLVGITVLLCLLWFLLLRNVISEEHIQEYMQYVRFGVWWVTLGILSSIGLGSGLHTFVLYLGPHIARFTIKATQCGRVDLKSAPYDTIQLNRVPSWLEKDCSVFGPALFPAFPDSLVRIPFKNILPQIQLEAVLWGLGTALGELPPYFISRAACMSGRKQNTMEDFVDVSSVKDGSASSFLNRLKRWLFSSSQHLNFFTILILASVPNPLFDLAGIMCGQLGVPFWQFFLATSTGKAIIKTHIQSMFIILVFNNQLLELLENELIWVLAHIPGFSSALPKIINRLHKIRETYLSAQLSNASNVKTNQWNLSFNLIWNTILWIMLLNFFCKIITATAQSHLRRRQQLELNKKSSASRHSKKKNDGCNNI